VPGVVGARPAVPGIAGIVLAGGAGRRMGGVDKAALVVDGVTLLDRVLGAAQPVCDRLVVVGPERPTGVAGVTFVMDTEPGGGPGAAVAAGLAAAPGAGVVLVLAADLPLLSAGHLRSLLGALEAAGAGAAAAADEGGPNPLLAAYDGPALAARAGALGAGARAGALLPADVVTVDLGRATLNVNRPEDLATAERLAAAPADGE
jgi:molybdopterin-guanine dinucleotide biosynthesis protein A